MTTPIDVRELRVGSYVQPKNHPIMQVVDINGLGTIGCLIDPKNSLDEYWEYTCDEVNPIPLSEEILLRCGFECHKSLDKHFVIENLGIAVSTAGNKFRIIVGNFICQLVICEVDFLHHLQNIVFELRGQELELKQ